MGQHFSFKTSSRILSFDFSKWVSNFYNWVSNFYNWVSNFYNWVSKYYK